MLVFAVTQSDQANQTDPSSHNDLKGEAPLQPRRDSAIMKEDGRRRRADACMQANIFIFWMLVHSHTLPTRLAAPTKMYWFDALSVAACASLVWIGSSSSISSSRDSGVRATRVLLAFMLYRRLAIILPGSLAAATCIHTRRYQASLYH